MEYTWASVVACILVIAVELLWFKTGLLRKLTFYVSWAIILFFMVLVDGWLTKLSAPIVLYNEAENSGVRFPWDIPVEDYLFGFALITLTMESTRKTIEALDSAGLRDRVKIGVGGAPLTQKFADEIGADFYASDAHECVQACNRLVP